MNHPTSWWWSSFRCYAGGKMPAWLETGRVLRAFQLAEDRRGGKAYGSYLETRVKAPESVINDAALGELRRGWVLGQESSVIRAVRRTNEDAREARKLQDLGNWLVANCRDPIDEPIY